METMIYALVGLLIGGIATLIVRQRLANKLKDSVYENESLRAENGKIESENAELKNKVELLDQNYNQAKLIQSRLEERNSILEADIRKVSTNYEVKERQFLVADKSLTEANKEVEYLNQKLEQTNQHKITVEEKFEVLKNQYNEEHEQLIKMKADFNALEDKMKTQAVELAKMQSVMEEQFKNMANSILEEKTKRFDELQKKELGTILSPLNEQLVDFKKKVEDVYDKESKERFSLSKEIQKLHEKSDRLSDEATQLTRALKGNTKTQGDWGEVILERILENSGLRKDYEYEIQSSLTTEDGKRIRPDVIIHYPDERQVIIDSKVSLTAYERYMSSEEMTEQNQAIKEHLTSIRKHIDELSAKNYHKAVKSLDFVMMFIPIEPAYLIAMEHDKELWRYAYEKGVMLIGPTTLILTLKLLEELWNREYQNRNVQEIAEAAAKMYDKLVLFIDELDKVGKSLSKAQNEYETSMKRLSTGKGNVISLAQNVKNLGVNPKKQLSTDLIEKANTTLELS